MKEIKTARYIKKKAIWSLPGDPGLPPGVTEEMISEHAGDYEEEPEIRQEGESEINVDWNRFNQWFSEGGSLFSGDMGNRIDPSIVKIEYTYVYDKNNDQIKDIKPIRLEDYKTGRVITNLEVIISFIEYYKEEIIKDIASGI